MKLIINQLAVNYEQYGDASAPAIVIIHGWADSGASWKSIAQSLAKSYYVIVPDLPGNGASEAPKISWGLHDYASFMQQFLAKAGIQPVAIIGHSNGGSIAIKAVADQLLAPQKLVLLASAGIRDQENGKKRALKLLAKTGKIITMPLPKAAKTSLRRKLYAGIGSDLLVAEHMQETFKRIVSEDVQVDAANLTTSTLLVYGEQDASTPVTFGEQYHQLIRVSTLVVVPNAGHFIQVDAPQTVITQIQEFLAT